MDPREAQLNMNDLLHNMIINFFYYIYIAPFFHHGALLLGGLHRALQQWSSQHGPDQTCSASASVSSPCAFRLCFGFSKYCVFFLASGIIHNVLCLCGCRERNKIVFKLPPHHFALQCYTSKAYLKRVYSYTVHIQAH